MTALSQLNQVCNIFMTPVKNQITHTIVNTGDWKDCTVNLPYNGKYQVGHFTLSHEFMIQYMNLLHNISITNDVIQAHCTTAADTIMYMEHYGIIDNSILLKMRQMVKKPKFGFVVYRDKNVITGIVKDSDNG